MLHFIGRHTRSYTTTAKVDWSDARQLACSEIRAAQLSGDCDYLREVERGRLLGVGGKGAKCARRRAALSVRHALGLSQAEADAAVDSVWDSCSQDLYPFAEEYRSARI